MAQFVPPLCQPKASTGRAEWSLISGERHVLPPAPHPGSSFNVFVHSPELGEDLRKVGSYRCFKSTLGRSLSERAILVTARYWRARYEWHAPHRLALQAGLDPKIAADFAQGCRPAGMKPDEAAVYTVNHERHHDKRVSAVWTGVPERLASQRGAR